MQPTTNSTVAFPILIGTYITFVLMSAINGIKLCKIGSLEFDGGLLIYASSFIIIDIVREVYGRDKSFQMVASGFFALIVMFLANGLVGALPSSPLWELEKEYSTIMGFQARIALAMITTFVVSQVLDLTLFAHIRKITNGKHLWLRYNISAIVSGGADAFIFTTIAFYGVFPVVEVALAAWFVRVVFMTCDTPIVYLGVWLVRKYDEMIANKKIDIASETTP